MTAQINGYQNLLETLEHLGDKQYKEFNAKITPDIGFTYGVRMPVLKELAKQLHKQHLASELLPELEKGRSFEETLLFGFLITKQSFASDAELFARIEEYIQLINNWALCDSFASALRPVVTRNREAFWRKIPDWVHPSNNPWEIRFGLVVLNNYFAKAQFLGDIFALAEPLATEHYYVKMALAWLLSTLYFCDQKQVEAFFTSTQLSSWVVNKAVQKILESRKLDPAHREAVKNLKRK